MPGDVPDFDECAEMIEALKSSWDTWLTIGTSMDMTVGKGLERAVSAFALCSHVHRLSSAALMLMRAGLVLEAVPTIRSMYECALTAQWVAQIDGAFRAFANKQKSERRKVLEGIPTLGLATATEADATEAIAELNTLELLETDVEATFRQICLALEPGGEQAYTHYRLQCQLTHASGFLMDHYLSPIETEPFIALRTTPEQLSANGWCAFVLASMVWAGAAVDYHDPTHSRSDELGRAQTFLGIERNLRPASPALKKKQKQKSS